MFLDDVLTESQMCAECLYKQTDISNVRFFPDSFTTSLNSLSRHAGNGPLFDCVANVFHA